MSEILKPCPFCGGEAFYIEIMGNYEKPHEIYCSKCDGAITEGRSEKQVVTNWNTRPIEDELQAENERLKEKLQHEKTRSQLNLEAEERRMLNITYYCAEIDRLNARIAVLEAERRWIPVSERLPDAYEKVIALAKDCMNVDWVLPKELREVGKGAFARLYNVTHWMPLPTPPEMQE